MEKTKRVSFSEAEMAVLTALVEMTRPEGEMCVPFSFIRDDTKLDRPMVRRACRSLARKGLAEFYRGLMNEDGGMAGSGYCATRNGRAVVEPEDDEQEHLGL